MINACLFRKDSRLSGFELSGHADSGEYGQGYCVCGSFGIVDQYDQ